MDAPVDRLLSLVDQPAVDEPAQRPRDCRLVPVVHRQVRMLPVAEDPQPLKLFGHHPDEALRVGAAGSSHVGERHLPLPRAELAVDLQLDGQPMAVVSRHVRRVEPRHGPRLHDEVLQDLVERGAEVNLAVRVRRTVVQNEPRFARPGPRGCVRTDRSRPTRRSSPAPPPGDWPSWETSCEADSGCLSNPPYELWIVLRGPRRRESRGGCRTAYDCPSARQRWVSEFRGSGIRDAEAQGERGGEAAPRRNEGPVGRGLRSPRLSLRGFYRRRFTAGSGRTSTVNPPWLSLTSSSLTPRKRRPSAGIASGVVCVADSEDRHGPHAPDQRSGEHARHRAARIPAARRTRRAGRVAAVGAQLDLAAGVERDAVSLTHGDARCRSTAGLPAPGSVHRLPAVWMRTWPGAGGIGGCCPRAARACEVDAPHLVRREVAPAAVGIDGDSQRVRAADVVEVTGDDLSARKHHEVLASGNLIDLAVGEARAATEVDDGHVSRRHPSDGTADAQREPRPAHIHELA